MFMSRQVEKTPKTKFRKGQSEEPIDRVKLKHSKKSKRSEHRESFDMWEDQPNDGC